ncbi:hypothetical protein H5410_060082 [Solanum commersonii]|uniref:Uncharacterized protein n=1 Tax=Solanum commersonii TaxID=4109 RepID=A0A9J5W4X7_SOLCO|nr:hypothetical protein H5410_060082 [Solanum commersonii]
MDEKRSTSGNCYCKGSVLDRTLPFQWCQDIPWEGHQIYSIRFSGIPICQLKVQTLLPQPPEAFPSLHGLPCTGSSTRRILHKKLLRRGYVPEVRDAAREAALREIMERIKKTKDEKKAKKAEVVAKSQKAGGKGNVSKGGSKVPKLGGGGGKR